MSSGHSHVLPNIGRSGASSEGYHSLASLPKHYAPTYSSGSQSGLSMHQQQQHMKHRTDLSQEFSLNPQHNILLQSAALQTRYIPPPSNVWDRQMDTQRKSASAQEQSLQLPPASLTYRGIAILCSCAW